MDSDVDTGGLGDGRDLLDEVSVVVPQLILGVLTPVHQLVVPELAACSPPGPHLSSGSGSGSGSG